MKNIFATGNNYVWIRSGSAWSSLPASVREALVGGLERISLLRDSIANSAKIAWMPPVEIVPQLWISEGGANQGGINGAAGLIPAPGRLYIGVWIPAQTALCDDEAIVRRILVHEFLHCFHFIEKAADRQLFGGPAPVFGVADAFDAKLDDAALADPFDWFGERDANSLIHHDDRDNVSWEPIDETVVKYIRQFGRTYAGPPKLAIGLKRVAFDASAMDRACELRRAKRPPH